MPYIRVDIQRMQQARSDIERIPNNIEIARNAIDSIRRGLDWDVACEESIDRQLRDIIGQLDYSRSRMQRTIQFLSDATTQYVKADRGVDEQHTITDQREDESFWSNFWDEYGWAGLLAGTNYIGKVYGFFDDIRKGKTWMDFVNNGIEISDFIGKAAKTYRNYKKIGNAVGTKTAMSWWAKNITGIKPLGRASTAKNPFTRFANNLTNKTSPFKAQFRDIVNTFKGKNGAGSAIASWAGVALNGIANWFSNKEEQANSNGTMSDARMWLETITETVVDTGITYGAGIIVGAAVTTVLGSSVAVPGLVITALGGAIIAGANVGIKALTGKTATEWISDTILDTGEAILDTGKKVANAIGNAAEKIGDAVGSAAQKVKQSIGNWFNKLSFA